MMKKMKLERRISRNSKYKRYVFTLYRLRLTFSWGPFYPGARLISGWKVGSISFGVFLVMWMIGQRR